MSRLWFNANGILHDGIGLVLCDVCPCDVVSSSVSDSGGSGSSSACPPGCARWEATYDENIDPDNEYDREFFITIEVSSETICPGDTFTVTITYGSGSTPTYAQISIDGLGLGYTLDDYTPILSPIPPYGLILGSELLYGPDDTGRVFEITLTAPESCQPLTIVAGSQNDRDTRTVRQLVCCE
jgi:hypothetical protein